MPQVGSRGDAFLGRVWSLNGRGRLRQRRRRWLGRLDAGPRQAQKWRGAQLGVADKPPSPPPQPGSAPMTGRRNREGLDGF